VVSEKEAYPCGRSYEIRVETTYQVGDTVTVGPAFMMGGNYRHDGYEGQYRVVEVYPSDYELESPKGKKVFMRASRLTLVRR